MLAAFCLSRKTRVVDSRLVLNQSVCTVAVAEFGPANFGTDRVGPVDTTPKKNLDLPECTNFLYTPRVWSVHFVFFLFFLL